MGILGVLRAAPHIIAKETLFRRGAQNDKRERALVELKQQCKKVAASQDDVINLAATSVNPEVAS